MPLRQCKAYRKRGKSHKKDRPRKISIYVNTATRRSGYSFSDISWFMRRSFNRVPPLPLYSVSRVGNRASATHRVGTNESACANRGQTGPPSTWRHCTSNDSRTLQSLKFHSTEITKWGFIQGTMWSRDNTSSYIWSLGPWPKTELVRISFTNIYQNWRATGSNQ